MNWLTEWLFGGIRTLKLDSGRWSMTTITFENGYSFKALAYVYFAPEKYSDFDAALWIPNVKRQMLIKQTKVEL
jgi:hypothetical protein